MKIKPATTLPWTNVGSVVCEERVRAPLGDHVCTCASLSAKEGAADAEYIVAACNAYPRLVEALRILASQRAAFAEDERAHADARELLRELGEL